MSKLNATILFILQLILVITLLSSCVTFKKCARKFGNMETKPITLKDTIDHETVTPWDSLSGFIPCPENTEREAVTSDTTVMISESGKAQIKYWFNQYMKAINYKVDCLPDTIKEKIPVMIKGDCPDVIVMDPKNASGFAMVWAYYQVFAGWALLLSIVVWIIYRLTRNKTVMYVEKDTSKTD